MLNSKVRVINLKTQLRKPLNKQKHPQISSDILSKAVGTFPIPWKSFYSILQLPQLVPESLRRKVECDKKYDGGIKGQQSKNQGRKLYPAAKIIPFWDNVQQLACFCFWNAP